MNVMGVAGMVLGAVGMVTVFSFIAVLSWVEGRRREREAFYRNDLLKQLAQQSGPAADRVTELLRDEERIAQDKAREGYKLGGVITTAVGIGLMVFLRMLVTEEEPVYLVGLIPLLVGVAMLFYVYALAPRAAGGQ
jgi:hypothetical protein